MVSQGVFFITLNALPVIIFSSCHRRTSCYTLGKAMFSLLGQSMQLTLKSTVKLNNGVSMPVLGLGVYQMRPGKETYQAVITALEIGYRLVDTASFYRNEEDVGRAVLDSGIPRSEIFITTKLWNDEQGYESALRAFDASLKRLGLGYIDLYLIHFPVPNLREESWRALEKILESGRVRAIGVSNYMEYHLKELLSQATVIPAVNQVEFSPFLNQQALLAFCRKNRVQVEAYAPLTSGHRIYDRQITAIATAHGRTNAQVLLRWALQQGLIIIPKSTHAQRIAENAHVFDFDLTPEEVTTLNSLHDGFRSSWDPTIVS